MEEYHFDSQDEDKPTFYIKKGASDKVDSTFYHYDTLKEAMALFQYLQSECPDCCLSLGIHKDFMRRADMIERIEGVTVLTDYYKQRSPWKDDQLLDAVAKEAAVCLKAQWQMDREFIKTPILIPLESNSTLNPFFEGKSLCPDNPEDPLTSLKEVYIENIGWVPLEKLKFFSKSHGYSNPKYPKVSSLLIRYQVDSNGFRGSTSISPLEYKIMEKRYLAQQEGRETLAELKHEARNRAVDKNQKLAGREKWNDKRLKHER